MTRLPLVLPLLVLVFLSGPIATSSAQAPDRETQIAKAVVPLPEDRRAGARVLGFDADGEVVEIREGTSEMVCLSDRPGDEEFHAACYHESLEPFMRRGRELRSAGYEGAEVDSVRRAELEAGEWSMPEHPAALFSVSGPAKAWNEASGTFEGGRSLHVVYTPYETGETVGLPTQPSGGGPWLMEPGAPWAHIMYSP